MQADEIQSWYTQAMARPGSIDRAEIELRKATAAAFNRQHGIVDADRLADQELYIQGKMEIEEYSRYLACKAMVRP